MQSLQFLIPVGRGLDAILPFTCYSDWFSCYFDERGTLIKALTSIDKTNMMKVEI
jgi:hypothetical protein